jgi:hypothetical protein
MARATVYTDPFADYRGRDFYLAGQIEFELTSLASVHYGNP